MRILRTSCNKADCLFSTIPKGLRIGYFSLQMSLSHYGVKDGQLHCISTCLCAARYKYAPILKRKIWDDIAGCSNVLRAAGGGTLWVQGKWAGGGWSSFPMGSYVRPHFARGERNYTKETLDLGEVAKSWHAHLVKSQTPEMRAAHPAAMEPIAKSGITPFRQWRFDCHPRQVLWPERKFPWPKRAGSRPLSHLRVNGRAPHSLRGSRSRPGKANAYNVTDAFIGNASRLGLPTVGIETLLSLVWTFSRGEDKLRTVVHYERE